MWKKTVGAFAAIVLGAILAFGAVADAETVGWTNPTMYADGSAISADNQAKIKNYLRYRVPPTTGTWTYFAETAGGKNSWVGTLPPAAGVAAEYTVSAALTGADGAEKDSDPCAPFAYTVPFPPGRTPGSPSGMTITR